MSTKQGIDLSYKIAEERFASCGVDTESAIRQLGRIPVSLHCWQGDDCTGFENTGGALTGGIMATGNYPGKARTPEELRADLEMAASLIPGPLRLNLHASYATDGQPMPDRDALTVKNFSSWTQWAAAKKWGIDFNPTCFSHPLAVEGFTLAHPDPAVRKFWIAHCIACRRIGAAIGEKLKNPVVNNIWIPDGYKDTPADRLAPRQRLMESLDAIFAAEVSHEWNIDTVEAKLFGIGVESYTVGSHEFYLGYASTRKIGLCLDAGHFHPTESVADKISSVLMYVPHLLLHVSRGVRWDSDHVVALDDTTSAILEESVTVPGRERIHVGLDFFDASINRIAAWVIGTRNAKKAMLRGLLLPSATFLQAESRRDFTSRLAQMEDARSLPWGLVWEEYCRRNDRPVDGIWLARVKADEVARLTGRR